MIIIDGSQGEGGGQILRTSLALSLVTGKAFRIERIRANRGTPGLLRQHLTAVNAASAIGGAEVTGAAMGASELTFAPQGVAAGDYHFVVGTAGSALLVLQAVLPPLMLAAQPSTLIIEGGTHNRQAPPFDFIERAFLPLVNRMGARVTATLERYGFYPAGGGRVRVRIEPPREFKRLQLEARGETKERRARAVVANLDRRIALRELAVIKEKLSWRDEWLHIEAVRESVSAGNYVAVEIESEHLTEVFTGFGERGVMAEAVAGSAANEARAYLASEAAVGEHLEATNIEVIKMFLDVEITMEKISSRKWRVEVNKAHGRQQRLIECD